MLEWEGDLAMGLPAGTGGAHNSLVLATTLGSTDGRNCRCSGTFTLAVPVLAHPAFCLHNTY